MKVFVTGAQGQLAPCLVERARNSEIDLMAIGRPQLDLAQPGSAAAAIQSIRPDVVINAAAYTAVDRAEDEPEQAFRINADGAEEVAAAAARIGATVVQLSTDYVFDGCSDLPYREDSATNPLGIYGASKLAGEERVRSANARHVIVRTSWLYSPFARNFVKTMMDASSTRDNIPVVDDQIGSPTCALDLADGVLKMVKSWAHAPDRGMSETFHLAGSGETSWFGLAEFVMSECRKRSLPWAEIRPIPSADWPTRAVRPVKSVLDSEKFARDFGFIMPAWQESVSLVVDRIAAERETDE
jgi:dTDP-4-dehydrorhamnose reductase